MKTPRKTTLKIKGAAMLAKLRKEIVARAWAIVRKEKLDFGTAQRKAWAAQALKQKLQAGEVVFEFKRTKPKAGADPIRKARGTLCLGVDNFAPGQGDWKKKSITNAVKFIDLDEFDRLLLAGHDTEVARAKSWRSFRASSLIAA